jgi:hypothetical protein
LPESLASGDIVDFESFLVDRGAQNASNLELLSPADILLSHQVVKLVLILEGFLLLFIVVTSLDINEAAGSLGEFGTGGHRVGKKERE